MKKTQENYRKILISLIAIVFIILIVVMLGEPSDVMEFQCHFSIGGNSLAAIMITIFFVLIIIEIIKKIRKNREE